MNAPSQRGQKKDARNEEKKDEDKKTAHQIVLVRKEGLIPSH